MSKQPDALVYAESLERLHTHSMAAELRRLHALNLELAEALEEAQRQQASAVKDDLPPGVVVSAYRIGDALNAVRIERAGQIDGPDLWAVRGFGGVLNKDGAWEWEPMPSNRDDAFLARCRFATLSEAISAAMRESQPPVQHKEQS